MNSTLRPLCLLLSIAPLAAQSGGIASPGVRNALEAFDRGAYEEALTEIDRVNTLTEGEYSTLRDALVAASLYHTAWLAIDALAKTPPPAEGQESAVDPEAVLETARIALRESIQFGMKSLQAGETDPRVGRNLRRAVDLLRQITPPPEPEQPEDPENEEQQEKKQEENERKSDEQNNDAKRDGQQEGEKSGDEKQQGEGRPSDQKGDPSGQKGEEKGQAGEPGEQEQGSASRKPGDPKQSGDPGEGAPEPSAQPQGSEQPPEPKPGEKGGKRDDLTSPDDAKWSDPEKRDVEKPEGAKEIEKDLDRPPQGPPSGTTESESGTPGEGQAPTGPNVIPLDIRRELERQRLKQILARLAEQREQLRRRRAEAGRRRGGRDW